MDTSVQQVVWEQNINWRECIKIFWEEYCIEIKGSIRITIESGNYFLEIDAFGQRWKYNLTASCFAFYEFGIARFKICAQPYGSSGAKIVLEGCIGVGSVEKCWTIFAQDIVWFNIKDVESDIMDEIGFKKYYRSSDKYPIFGNMSSKLNESEIQELLSL